VRFSCTLEAQKFGQLGFVFGAFEHTNPQGVAIKLRDLLVLLWLIRGYLRKEINGFTDEDTLQLLEETVIL
jgi:hypothetical protein